MDLNLDNYSIDEVKDIFNINDIDIKINNARQLLIEKIDNIKKVSQDELPESKETLIEFYTKAMFKLLSIPINNSKIDNSIIKNFEKNDTNVYDIDERQSKEFISVKDKLIPPLEYTQTVQTNNNFITRHTDSRPVNIFSNPLKAGYINPLTRNTFKKILNINTKFRDNYTITDSTNFIIELPSTIKQVVSMKLLDTQFPETVYTVSDKLGSNVFFLEISGNYIPIDISNGSYNQDSIMHTINNNKHMKDHKIVLDFDENNGLMTFISTTNNIFGLNFSYDKVVEFYNLNKSIQNKHLFCPNLPSNIFKDQLTLGWILGFRGDYIKPINTNPDIFCNNLQNNRNNINFKYSGETTYTSESLFDNHGSKYFLMSINDFQRNHNSSFISPFKYQTISDNNIIAKIPTDCCNDSCNNYPERIYFGQVDIAKLDIKIYDEFGRIIDINNADYSFTLRLELLYDL